VAFVVSPRAGDSHKVGGEFAEDQFQLLICWLLEDMCQDNSICALILSAEIVSDMVVQSRRIL
jgi:hypothetical protein